MHVTETASELEALAEGSLAGDGQSFARLALAMWPLAEAAARRAPNGEARDEAQELYARLLERLERDDFAALREYRGWKARHPEKDFLDWARIVMANLRRDRHRERVGRKRDDHELPTAKRLLNELAALVPLEDAAYRPPVTEPADRA